MEVERRMERGTKIYKYRERETMCVRDMFSFQPKILILKQIPFHLDFENIQWKIGIPRLRRPAQFISKVE